MQVPTQETEARYFYTLREALMAGIDGVNLPFMPIGGIEELNKQTSTGITKVGSSSEFGEIFAQELENVKFSAHAQSRLTSKEIDLSENDMLRLNSAVDKLEQKGGNESLVILDEKAFVVSVPNRTVITAMNNSNMENSVITNIDSAVFA